VSEDEVESTAGASPFNAATPDDHAADDASSENDGSPAEDSPVAGALAELDTLADRDLAEHPEVFDRIHAELYAALTAIDDA
jgi:hypothetical protein